MDRSLIDRYAEGAELLHRGLEGLSEADLHAAPPPGSPGTWNLQTIIVHVMDSDLVSVHRMKRIIAEDKPPLLIAYDENAFARSLFYERLSARAAADIYRANRRFMADILRQLPDQAFARVGIHNENGKQTLAEIVKGYTWHTEHHMTFLREKRRLMGKPMP